MVCVETVKLIDFVACLRQENMTQRLSHQYNSRYTKHLYQKAHLPSRQYYVSHKKVTSNVRYLLRQATQIFVSRCRIVNKVSGSVVEENI